MAAFLTKSEERIWALTVTRNTVRQFKENIIIELKYIKDIIPYDNPPKVTLTAKELEDLKYKFEANAESETGIDFFSWDLLHNENEFKADVVMDKHHTPPSVAERICAERSRSFAPRKKL